MNTLELLLQGLVENPGDEARYLVLADWLEEHDNPRRAELLRLHRRLLAPSPLPERAVWQARVGELLGEGVRLDPRCWQAGFRVTDQYLWVPQLNTLPVCITFDVTCGSSADEVLPCFSHTRAEWGSPDCDALCWSLSPKLDVFTFRTNLFGSFPATVRHRPAIKAEVGSRYRITCDIAAASASYSINEEPYATAAYDPGAVPATGYFGFAVYHRQDIMVEDIRITPL
jgi:uncharacterized protein (TIGR02996 family)